MVRSLDGALTAALNNSTRIPALKLTIEDHVIHYAQYQNPATADAWNDACIASDNSIVRVQVTRGGSGFTSSFQVQRITDPSQASQWASASWTTLSGSSGLMFQDGGCAISNSAGILRAFAQRGTGGNNLWVWTSTDNGVTWSGPVSVLSPPSSALLKGIGSAGNNDVFFLYDVTGGEAMGCSFHPGGSWSALTTWTLATINYGAGVAVAWANSTYTIVYSDSYSLFSCVYNPSNNTWSSSSVIAPATSTAIGRIAPRLSLADGIYTLACIEFDNGVLSGSVYSYPRLRQSADLVHWSNGLIMHDITCSYGVTAFKLPVPHAGSAGPRYYVAALPVIFSAPAFQASNPAQSLDVSASVLSYQRHEQQGKPARLQVMLDNARGVYNAFVTTGTNYQPIGLNATLILSEGYKTGTPPSTPDVVQVGMYHLEQIHFIRSPQENHLLLVGLDLSRNLDVQSRYQNTYSNETLGYLIAEVSARAGLFNISAPATSQMSQVVPSFILQAGQLYRHALNELCATYGLSYFLDQSEVLQFRELSNSDPWVWSYQPEIELVSFGSNDLRANHIIVSGKPPTGGIPGALTTSEAYDDAHVHLVGMERLLHRVDQKLVSTTQCAQKATFLMAQETRTQVTHTVSVPLNPALQLLDGITLTDSGAPIGSGQNVTCRITHLLAHFDAQLGANDLQLTLEGL
ncbi:MAG TPA: sialidase family protein [Ktedonobacteraceae bacterium]|nr:sialidase family protein [Ktedonobacteraceae bacterium]